VNKTKQFVSWFANKQKSWYHPVLHDASSIPLIWLLL